MVPEAVWLELEASGPRRTQDLVDFLAIPSVSTSVEHTGGVRQAAAWLRRRLEAMGFVTELVETQRHPVILAQRLPHENGPTVLIYGHYDVQPTDPDGEWESPPFSPSIVDNYVYARGASDDKGQLLTHLHALEAVVRAQGELPINVKVLLEGEEEIGSPSLPQVLAQKANQLQAQAVVISDGCQFAPGVPAITYGLRGLSYLQIDVRGARLDLHSGSFGGIVTNPVQALCQILCSLKNPEGTVGIPGFYDEVLPLEPWEREEISRLPFEEHGLREYLGVDVLTGEANYGPLERRWARPTLDVNGIWGGFSGPGAKTVIPSRAGAKVSMRLVPRQDPARINELFKRFVEGICPQGVRLEITEFHGAKPVLVDRNLPQVKAAARAIEAGFGRAPVFIREGGSIPVVNMLKEILGIEAILLLGWGSPEDGAHSPNERFSLENFHAGTRASAALLYELAR